MKFFQDVPLVVETLCSDLQTKMADLLKISEMMQGLPSSDWVNK